MERIKLAIEKAKAGGTGSTGPAVTKLHKVNESRSSVKQVGLLPYDEEQTDQPAAVQYARTAVVSLDPAHLERHRVVSQDKSHPASWSFDVLRTQVLQQMDEHGWRTLAITSPSVESGKTLVAINLALSIAQQTHRTALLVDFDLRRPCVAKTLGIHRSPSLNEVLEGGVGVDEALVNPTVERFVVLITNEPVPRASEMLSSPKVTNLITELRDRYSDRVVIFDLPPTLAADDVMTVLPRIDCVLLVVGNGVSTQNEIDQAMNRLSKANLIGVVLNKDEAPAPNPYY